MFVYHDTELIDKISVPVYHEAELVNKSSVSGYRDTELMNKSSVSVNKIQNQSFVKQFFIRIRFTQNDWFG